MARLFDAYKFGERLKSYRLKNHLSQMELAEKIGSATSSISHLENGTHSPSLETLLKLSRVLHIGVDDILCDSLPAVAESHLDRDFEELLLDCSVQEKRLLLKSLQFIKKLFREIK